MTDFTKFVIFDLSITFLAIILIWYFGVGRQIIRKRKIMKEIKDRNKSIVKK
ncbi:MAG: hypothetical protein PHY80_04350 [Rickettsiales bacterium]|nr:hypothetical protein [Rickettsiales bacterium]